MSQRYLAIGLSFLLAFLLVSASAVAQDLKVVGAPEISEPGVSGGRLVIGTIGEGPKTLNDLIAQETSSTNITGLMHAGLIDISPVTAAVEPGLAKSWEISPDNRTITFNLRQGLTWSDGVPFTADDITFYFNDLVFNEDVNTDYRDVLEVQGEPIKVEKIDDFTVRISMVAPFRPILRSLTGGIMPKHKLADKVHKLNPDVPAGTFNDAWSIDTPPEEFAGMGPFMLKELDAQQAVLVRNPNYWKVDEDGTQLPYLDEYVFLFLGNSDIVLLKFKTGELDVIGPRAEDWPFLVLNAERENWELVQDGPTFGTNFVVFNQDIEDPVLQEVFRNVRFRHAVAHAIDKNFIIDEIYNGLAVPQWSPVSIPSPFFDDNEAFATYEYDLDRAAQLLDEIGLTDTNGDGIRELPDGRDFEFRLVTNTGNTVRIDIGNLLKTDLEEIGIKVNFQPIEFNTLVGQLLGNQYEGVIIGLTGGVEPNNGANVWQTTGGLHFWRYSAAENPPEWERRVDELLDTGVATFDFDEAKAAYVEYQRLVSENIPLIYTVNQQYLYASKAIVGNNDGFNPNGSVLGFADSLWFKDATRRAATR